MARVAGVDLPKEKPVSVGLQYIYGIGSALSGHILTAAEIDPTIKIKDLT